MRTLQNIDINNLERSALSPRQSLPKESLRELAESIRNAGVIHPLIVREFESRPGIYEIVDGARRYEAGLIVGLAVLPCLVEELTDSRADGQRLIANLQREDLHPLEEAKAFKAFMEIHQVGMKELSEHLGKSESYIAESLNLLNLGDAGREHFAAGVLTIEHARILAKLTPEDQEKAVLWLVNDTGTRASRYGGEETVILVAKDVKLFRSWVDAEVNLLLSFAPWDKSDATLVESAGACLTCPKNSGANRALFPELQKDDTCTDRACFRSKLDAYRRRMQKATRKAEKKDFLLLSVEPYLDKEDPLKVDGVKNAGRYRVITEKNACEFSQKGQFIDGPGRGKFVLVCNYSKCAKHWGGPGVSASAPAAEKAPRNQAELVRQQNNQRFEMALGDKLTAHTLEWLLKLANRDKVRPHLLRAMVQRACDELYGDVDSLLELAGYGSMKALRKAAGSMKVFELSDALGVLNILADDYGREDTVSELAKELKVDLKAMRTTLEKDLHRCEVCRCSEISACTNKGKPCSWRPEPLKAGKYICTGCEVPAEKEPAPAKTAKPKKGGKGK